jgi:hypothetical protein
MPAYRILRVRRSDVEDVCADDLRSSAGTVKADNGAALAIAAVLGIAWFPPNRIRQGVC